jgi:hypothetical protein
MKKKSRPTLANNNIAKKSIKIFQIDILLFF